MARVCQCCSVVGDAGRWPFLQQSTGCSRKLWSLWPPGTLWLTWMGAGGWRGKCQSPELRGRSCTSPVCAHRFRVLVTQQDVSANENGNMHQFKKDWQKPLSKLMKTPDWWGGFDTHVVATWWSAESCVKKKNNNKKENVFSLSLHNLQSSCWAVVFSHFLFFNSAARGHFPAAWIAKTLSVTWGYLFYERGGCTEER